MLACETLVLSSTVSSGAPQFHSVILVDHEHSEDSYCYQIITKQSQYQELHGSSKLMTKITLRLVRRASKRSTGTLKEQQEFPGSAGCVSKTMLRGRLTV